jgi:hypothetical protein
MKKRLISYLLLGCILLGTFFTMGFIINADNNMEPPELIQNPGFDTGIADWYCVNLENTSANAAISWDTINYDTAPGSLRVQCADNGGTYKDIQLLTSRFSLVKDTTYLLRFRAQSSQKFTVPYIKLNKAASPWNDYASPFSGLTVTTDWEEYAALFTANATVSDARLTFFLGNALPEGAVMNIDAVSLKKTIVYGSSPGELLPNPDFDKGVTYWNLSCDASARANRYLDAADYDTAPVSYKIQCSDNGNTLNSIQLFTMPFPIIAGKSYLLTFKAKCDSIFAIPSIRLMKATSPWTNYASPYSGLTIAASGAGWYGYTIRFTANATANDGRLTFFLGNALPDGAAFKIDSVSLKEEGGAPTVAPTPIVIPPITTPMVAAGADHSLALKSDGTVWGWGANENGQLGDGTSTSKGTPVQVVGLTNVKRIAAGGRMSLAVKTDGAVWVWGYNRCGLGAGVTQSYYPLQVPGLLDIEDIAVGNVDAGSTNSDTCYVIALKKDGTVWGWGYNANGNLGDGTMFEKATPVQVKNLTDITAISTWLNHTLALKNDGTVWGWGSNMAGQLGRGNTFSSTTPAPVSGLTDAVSISTGANFSIARKSDGSVWVWGYNSGSFGNGSTAWSFIPIRTDNLGSFTSFSSGYLCSHGLTSDGSGWSWGYNGEGQLGDGTAVNRLVPAPISGLSGISRIASGYTFTLAVKSDGTVWAWGRNSNYQLGDGTTTTRYSPVQVIGLNLD